MKNISETFDISSFKPKLRLTFGFTDVFVKVKFLILVLRQL